MNRAAFHVQVQPVQHPRIIGIVAHVHIVGAQGNVGPCSPSTPFMPIRADRRRGSRATPRNLFEARLFPNRRNLHRLRRKLRHLLGHMRGHDDRQAQFALHAGEHEGELALRRRVELRRRLVEQDEGWAQDQDGREVEQLLLAARKLVGASSHPGGDAEVMRDLGHAPAHDVHVGAEVLQSECELVPDGVADDLGIGVLHDETDVARRERVVHSASRGPVVHQADPTYVDVSAICASRRQLGLERAQKRRLAAPRQPGNQAKRPLFHLKRQRSDDGRPFMHARAHASVIRTRIGKREIANLD